jgi:membrane-bound serine protease (ClpP class)
LLVLLGVCLSCAGPVHSAEQAPKKYSRGVVIHFEGEINPKLEYYLDCKLNAAKKKGVDLVIIEIHSPGGYAVTSLDIAMRLSDLDWAHTVAYVPERALSGAAIVALGCDEIIMRPNAALGDAGVISPDAEFQFRYVPEKFFTPLMEGVRTLATAKGRPPALAEAMVDKDLEVFRVKDPKTGEETFLSDKDIESDREPDRWEKINKIRESADDRFLQVNGTRAVELGLAEGNTSGLDELIRRYRLKDEPLFIEYTGVDTAVYYLNSPWITGLLFVVGLVALYIELSAPGIGVGGLTAGLCFAIFFWSRFLGGTADMLDVILFAAGVAFLLVEIFVLPGFGVAGLSGMLLILASLVLASQSFFIPHTEQEWAQLTSTLLVMLVSGLIFAGTAYVLSKHFGSFPLLNRLVLVPPDSGGGQGTVSSESGHRAAVRVGSCGVAVSALRPAGKARFGDQYLDVVTEGAFITKGSRVEVFEIYGNRVVVGEVATDQSV